MITVEINNLVRARIDQGFIENTVKSVLKKLKVKKANVSIALVDRKTIRQLNKWYRGKDKVTDVLSFGTGKPRKFTSFFITKNYIGEIVICYSQTKKQAREFGHTIKKELKILLTHGLLHLLGYNHQRMKNMLTSHSHLVSL